MAQVMSTAMPSDRNYAEAQRLNSVGLAAQKTLDHTSAIAAFSAAIVADPTATPLWRNLASAYRMVNDHLGEAKALDSALAIDRTDFAAWLRKAQLHQKIGDESEAFMAWSGVLQLAAGISNPAQQIVAELDAGAVYLAGLQRRLDKSVSQALRQTLSTIDGQAAIRANTFVDAALGRRQIFQNQCAGLQYPFLPADEFFDPSHFPWFAEFSAQTQAIQTELESLLQDADDALRPYVRLDPGTPDNCWTALDGSIDCGRGEVGTSRDARAGA